MTTSEFYIEVGGKCGDYFSRNMVYPITERNKALENILSRSGGTDAYYCTYVFDKKDRSKGTRYYSSLYFDIDGEIDSDDSFEQTRMSALSLVTALNTELRIKPSEIQFYFSGSKGFHLLIDPRVINARPSQKLNMAYKCLAMYLRTKIEHPGFLDTKIYDNKRLIRLPNTINSKTGLYKIAITYQELRTIKRDELFKLAQNKRATASYSTALNNEAATRFIDIIKKIAETVKPRTAHSNCKIPDKIQKLPVCAKYLFNTHADKGERNNTLAIISSILVQNGYTGDKALEIIYGWNEQNPEPLSDEEVEHTYKSVERMAQNGRGYGCTSIRERNLFPPRQVCISCSVYKHQRSNANN